MPEQQIGQTMARTPSMTTTAAEQALGPRGSIHVNADNRGLVRKWLVAQGFPALFVGGLSMSELALAYNQTDGAILDKLRAKLAETMENGDSEQEAAPPPATDARADKALKALELLGGLVDGKLDEARVRQIADEQIAKQTIKTTRFEIKHRTGQVTGLDGHFHPMFATLAKMATAFGQNGYVKGIMLSGEASSGKTFATRQLAKVLGLDFHINGAISQPHEMLGFIDGHGNYHRTPFRQAYEHGGVYVFDEMDRCSDPSALLAVNPHLEDIEGTFPDRVVQKHPNCIIIGTGNTWGTGADAQYSGATKLDGAFLSRFPQRIRWNIDLDMERAISGNEAWALRVQAARKRAQAAGLKVMIDSRITLAGAAMIAAGFSEQDAAEHTYLANLSDAQRAMVEN